MENLIKLIKVTKLLDGGALKLDDLMDMAIQLTRTQFHKETITTEKVQAAFANHLNFISGLTLECIKLALDDEVYKEIIDQIE